MYKNQIGEDVNHSKFFFATLYGQNRPLAKSRYLGACYNADRDVDQGYTAIDSNGHCNHIYYHKK